VLALIALVAPAAPATQAHPQAMPQMNMMAQADARDAEIAKLSQQMNHATGQAKVEAMAQLLNVLVQDRAGMRDQMRMMQHMHEMMMQGPMNHGEMHGTAPAPAK
jgi:hypothetical protein